MTASRKTPVPTIGITKPSRRENAAYALVKLGVRLAGARAVAVTTAAAPKRQIDGLILGGGEDVFPMLFDDTPKQGYVYDRARDSLEIMLCDKAIKDDVPVLGICRGAQLINVAYGGSLHLDMAAAYEDAHYPDSLLAKIFYRKKIKVVPGSSIARALRRPETLVNSLHKQSVKTLGDGLEATAVERNGVVQAIEDRSRSFVLGVQFHPEFMLHRRRFRNIFKLLVENAKRTASFTPMEVAAVIEKAAA